MNKLISLLAGIIFGTGLVISEMINPEKVLNFLDVFGNWDPSLAFVMIGALIISSPLFHLIKNNKKPLLADSFNYSKNKDINKRLIIGAALFGAGSRLCKRIQITLWEQCVNPFASSEASSWKMTGLRSGKI